MHQKRFLKFFIGITIFTAIILVAVYFLFRQNGISPQKPVVSTENIKSNVNTENETANWRTYVNLKYAYLIKYPVASKLEIITAGSVEPYDVVDIKSSPQTSGPLVGILPLSKIKAGQDLESYVKQYLEIYQNFHIVSLIHTTINSNPAIIAEVEWQAGNFRNAFVENDNRVFRIDLPRDDLAEQIVNSFRYLDPIKDKELQQIIENGYAYVKNHSAQDVYFDLSLIRQVNDYTLLEAIARYDKTDPAQVIMEKVNGTWEGQDIGTAFPEWQEKIPALFQQK